MAGGEGGVAGGEGGVAEQQQQLLQSIHAIIADLEAEKRSFLGMLDSSQVCCWPSSHNCPHILNCTHPLLDHDCSLLLSLFIRTVHLL